MLSILIPVFNFEIVSLVKDLVVLCNQANIDYEVRCYDDGSQENFKLLNRTIGQWEKVEYRELPQNIGRSKIRNLLADDAAFEFLLFMDGDSKVVSERYIFNYLTNLDPRQLLYGGRSYGSVPPDQTDLLLHWTFGSKREVRPAKLRTQKPYQSFMTNNFLIPRAIFNQIRFDERLKKYGHEDTLFGLGLKEKAIAILHLDNPLEHIGLESNQVFLQKTLKSIDNLWFLYQQGQLLPTKLLSTYLSLHRIHLVELTGEILTKFKPFIMKNLRSGSPKIWYLDLFKLEYLIRYANNQKK